MNTEITKTESNESQLPSFDLSKPLPDLSKGQELPFDLMADYWTPESKGENKRLFFDKIAIRPVKDIQNPDVVIELECAFFLEQTKDGKGKVEIKSISNGSKKLVGALQANNILRGTPLLVTYLGKKKNQSNNFQSDNWSIKPLIITL